jgi:hypothetical protein
LWDGSIKQRGFFQSRTILLAMGEL